MDPTTLKLVRFDPDRHNMRKIRTGNDRVDTWARSGAKKASSLGTSNTRVLVEKDSGAAGAKGKARVWGFFSLAATAIDVRVFPPEDIEKLPQVPIPGVLLTWLGVDQKLQGSGWGKALVLKAGEHAVMAADHIGAFCFAADAIDSEVVGFYERLGFHALPDQPDRLFMHIEKMRSILSQ